MATIGLFTCGKSGGYTGSIRTLTCSANVSVVPVGAKATGSEPDFRVFAGRVDLGVGWRRTSERGRDYAVLALDDPSFARPLEVALLPVEGDASLFALVWNRPPSSPLTQR